MTEDISEDAPDFFENEDDNEALSSRPSTGKEERPKSAASNAQKEPAKKAAGEDETKPEIVQDPYFKAMDYLEEHNIIQLFQKLTAAIVFERPADPVQFIMDKAEEIADTLDDKEVQRLSDAHKK